MSKTIKVLFVTQTELPHYRVPIFRLVNGEPGMELTLAHCGERVVQSEMSEILLKRKKIGPFYYFAGFRRLVKGFDVLLFMSFANNLSFLDSLLLNHRKKVVSWGIGVPASYKRDYGDAGALRYWLTNLLNKKTDARLLYSDTPLRVLEEKGYPQEMGKVFIANNTVEVIRDELDTSRKSTLLFIGTLYPEKGLQLLLDAYKSVREERADILPLNIVGEGQESARVGQWIADNGLEDKIHMLGPIYDAGKKAALFKESIACISPLQAGLSVLESMGYGVPYITSANARTGGEAFNITQGETGLRLDDVSKLKDVIMDICDHPEKFIDMGRKAYDYYWNNRTPQMMADGMIAAIKYANE